MIYPLRRIRSFFKHHWITLVIIFFVLAIIALSIIGLWSLESFYRKQMIAMIPVQIFQGMLHALIFAFIIINMQGRGFTRLNKSRIKAEEVNITFDDVIGIDESKLEASEVVELIKDRKRLDKVGGKIIRGLLMIGPPGCGKTLLAKAIATEAKIPFISIAGSEFVEVFVGVGASRVRKLFKQARQLAYDHGACIVFIDELDVIGRGRQFSFFGGGGETNSTQNQLLVEMDGLGNKKENIIVIGATNAAEGVLDEALLRPGRFDRKIFINKPFEDGREALFRYYLSKVQHDKNIDYKRWARRTVGKSPAEIENVVKEAALIATRREKDLIDHNDLSSALERIELGIKHHRRIPEKELIGTAYHEAGHLLAVYFLMPTHDVFKASIATRDKTLGVVLPQPREEIISSDRESLLANIKVSLAGYVAEKVKFKTTTTGVGQDFRQAMATAYHMVWNFGMSDGTYLGDYTQIKELSDNIKERLNSEVEKIIADCSNEVENLLIKEMPLFDRFAMELLKNEELDYDEIEAIFQEYGKSRNEYLHKTMIQKDSILQKIIEERNLFFQQKLEKLSHKNNGSDKSDDERNTDVPEQSGKENSPQTHDANDTTPEEQ